MINPQDEKDLKGFQFFFNVVKETMGFVPNSMKTMARIPAVLGGFAMLSGVLLADPEKAKPSLFLKLVFRQLGWAGKFMKNPNRISPSLRHLVSHVTSRAAGCQYCQAHTISSAAQSNVDKEKLLDVWNFESSSHFNDAERSALRFGIAAGSTPNAVTKEHFDDLRIHYSEEQIVELGAVVSLFGFLNRWNETFATQLESEPLKMANDLLKLNGWTPGRHA